MKMSDERGSFEKSWEKVFSNAEMDPSSAVWDAIETKLAASDNKGKRRFLFIKLAVAASLVFALSLAFYSALLTREDHGEKLAQTEDPGATKSEEGAGRENSNLAEENGGALPLTEERASNPSDQVLPKRESRNSANDTSVPKNQEGSENFAAGNRDLADSEMKSPDHLAFEREIGPETENQVETEKSGDITLPSSTFAGEMSSFASLTNLGLAMLTTEPGEVQEIRTYPLGYDLIKPDRNKKNDKGDLFVAGVNFSAGTFDPGVSAASSPSPGVENNGDFATFSQGRTATSDYGYAFYASNVNAVNNSFTISESDSYKESVAYSYGANLGYKISRRLIIYSGINYTKAYSKLNSNISITQNGNRVANAVVTNKTEHFSDLSETGNSDVVVDNAYEFASVPVKAGYMIIDSRLNLTLLTGVSSEFLLNSSYSSSNEPVGLAIASDLEDTKDESYNTIFFNGILGVNLGYTFFEKYRLSVEPSLRKSLSSFLDNENETSRPLYKMVSFGISYEF